MPDVFHLTALDTYDRYGKLLNLSIYQGVKKSFVIYYPDKDLTGYTLTGHIRKNYADNTNTILTSFNFLNVTYGNINANEGFFSLVTPYLNPSQTQSLPVTKNRTNSSDRILVGSNVYVYDIEAKNPNNAEDIVKLIYPSYIEVRPEVTRL